MIKTLIFASFLSAHSCHAFQVAPSARRAVTTSSRVLIPHRLAHSHRSFGHRSQNNVPSFPSLYQSFADDEAEEDDEVGFAKAELLVDTEKETSSNKDLNNSNNSNALVNFGNKLKQAFGGKQTASFFLSLSIFLLPFFLLSSFPESAWAVQSGGRMGGSFGGGGSSRQSSSRSYSSPSMSSGYSRGYSRGYSSGYYSRPNVIVTPGISPFYR